MKKSLFTLEKTEKIAGYVFALSFCGDTSGIVSPGQFVEIELPGKFLRRPISVADWKKGRLLLLVKEVGIGTNELVNSPIGTEFDMLTGLGNGFDISKAADNTILAGGGIGKLISPQSIAIGVAAIGLEGSDGKIITKTVGICIVLGVIVCIMSYLLAVVL